MSLSSKRGQAQETKNDIDEYNCTEEEDTNRIETKMHSQPSSYLFQIK